MSSWYPSFLANDSGNVFNFTSSIAVLRQFVALPRNGPLEQRFVAKNANVAADLQVVHSRPSGGNAPATFRVTKVVGRWVLASGWRGRKKGGQRAKQRLSRKSTLLTRSRATVLLALARPSPLRL